MAKILVTGGSGFLGVKLIERLISEGEKDIRVVARNEGKLVELKQKFPIVEIITGDIADEFICRKALDDIDQVFHLAASKHVGIAERQPYQTIGSNIIGTIHLLNHFVGHTFMAISTDKAAQINGVYGASKFLMEKLIQEYAEQNPFGTYHIVRYGNVIYSTGSVLCKWKELIENNTPVTITDPEATRFFWTVDQAIDLIFDCLDKDGGRGVPYIPKMKSIKVEDLFTAMIEKYGKQALAANVIGLQPGENLHETMDGKVFSNQVKKYTIEEIKELI